MGLPEPWATAKAAALPWLPSGALYVTRSDALPTTPPTLVGDTLTATDVRLAPPAVPVTSNADLYTPAVCLVGWPATYACPSGLLWQPPSPSLPGSQPPLQKLLR